MTVAAYHNRESGGFGLVIQLRQIVQYVDGNSADFKHLSFWQLARPRSFVDVAPDGCNWGDGRERFEDLRRAYVAGMNDVFGAAQGFDGLRPQQAVRVGDDTDEDGSSQFSVRSSRY